MIELIQAWWPVVPSIIAAATVIAKITPNETDNKIVFWITEIVGIFGVHAEKTQLK